MVNKKLFFSIVLFSSPVLFADYVLLPDKSYDLSSIPPFVQNLSQHERVGHEVEERQQVQEVVEQVVQGEKQHLQNDIHVRAHDPTSVAQSPDRLPQKNKEPLSCNPRLQRLLHEVYQDPVLRKKSISLSLNQAPIRDVLDLIVQQSGLNFVIDPDVTGMVARFHLTKVSVATALRVLLRSNRPRLALLKEGEVWQIVLQSTAYELLQGRKIRRKSRPLVSVVVTMHHLRWSETFKIQARTFWYQLSGAEVRGKGSYLVINDETRKLFFRGRASQIERFKNFLSELDSKIPRINIEARIVIAKKDFERSFGVQWSGIYNQKASVKSGVDFIGVGKLNDIQNEPVEPADLMDWVFNLFPVSWERTRNFNIPVVFGGPDLRTRRLNVVLNAAENRNEIKTILKPSILMNDKEYAEILEGETIPIETIVEESVEGRLRNVRTATYKDVGVQLRIRPTVSPNRQYVTLDVYVENSMVDENSMSSGATSTTGTIYPTIITSRSKTTVRIRSGETTMISGLIRNRKNKEKTALPFLGRIPVLGWLFKGYRKVVNDLELIVFLTARVEDV